MMECIESGVSPDKGLGLIKNRSLEFNWGFDILLDKNGSVVDA